MKQKEQIQDIERLKKEKNAVILAHYYQTPEIQELGDFVGDSLFLAQKAKSTNADIIVFCGVHFMAETAKILNPDKKVILPDLKAGCSLAESCDPEELLKFKKKHPDYKVVSYINTSAGVKTLTDIAVTSSNAEKIINTFPKDEKILFAPDKNLGAYLNKKMGRNMLLWDGVCIVHEAFSLEKLQNILIQYPKAKVIAHPESNLKVLELADFIGSTSALLKYVEQDDSKEYLVGTEIGIFHEMEKVAPHKTFIPIPTQDDNDCSCSECAFMKMNTLEKLYLCMKNESPEILLDENTIERALPCIEKMLELS
ncbi:quinolinate synthase NadA [Ichthyobacterium seriolicida]|uniref:Quinolinate synthase n=1 Tax=Ichthyobacterium seriolicida TaxID=242600 RepID=A0A1J1DYP2_9FLAO|nr:quinolinate synthase NadA [Ichthyobacterium seriolicida]BAV95031.1 quinolinate synthetase [Ichthyobacterium seriolicida]